MSRTGRQRVPEYLFQFREQYVTVAGDIAAVAVEQDADPRKIDHVWLTVRAGEFGRLQISLSTLSRHSRAAGFDPRVRLGIVMSDWTELPRAGVRAAAAFDYASVEAVQPVDYVAQERSVLEELLVAKARRAIFAEAWGEFYMRAHIGIHQVHSRRASFAVTRDVVGQDGALRFYFAAEKRSELLLFKYAGQP
jgi:hypothetical protein